MGKIIESIYCPVCGQENNCAHANHKDGSSCWCMDAKIPDDVLKSLQGAKTNDSKGCFCKSCVEEFKKKLKK